MIAELLNTIAERLLPKVQKPYGLGNIIVRDGDIKVPAFFNKEPLAWQPDNFTSSSLFVMNGPVTCSQSDNEVSCGVYETKTVPLRLFVYSNTNSSQPCSFFDEQLANDIIALLVFQQDRKLAEQYTLDHIELTLTGNEYRHDIVYGQLFGMIENKIIEPAQLFSIDLSLTFTGNPACWFKNCDYLITEDNINILP
ncbi:MAG TPA: hypothetical protein VG603_02390 [Chitinophagales bacterium]|nr:hypothetical protein [Chitinophagales bacterium]